MTSDLHFDLFMQEMRKRAAAAEPKQLSFKDAQFHAVEDVGVLRLSQIAAALRGARADSSRK
jgi:hypothetical protein